MSHIVLIDDDPDFSAALAAQWRRAGHLITCASSCAEGLDVLGTLDDEHEIDAVLVDMFMPDADGLETIKALRHAGLSAPLIAISAGRSQGDVLAWARGLGADASLTKPFAIDGLIALLDAMTAEQKWPC